MRTHTPLLLAAALLSLGACDEPTAPDLNALETPPLTLTATGGGNGLRVMSYNLYVGADLDVVMQALVTPDRGDDFPALIGGIQTLQATDFPARAEVIADAIGAAHPDVIGLQEVWNIAIDLRPYGVPLTLNNDFLPILQNALARRGLDYAVAGSVTNTDASPLPGIRAVDHDVILVDRARVDVHGAISRNFQANIGTVAPGLSVLRGYVIMQAAVDGQEYTFVNTHLESGASAQIAGLRAYQVQELTAVLTTAPRVVLTGDLNDGSASTMHQILVGAGFVDAWPALRPGVTGLTCCHEPDLSDTRGGFDQRIDYVMARGLDQPGQALKGQIDILGDQPKDRLVDGDRTLWPSDHAGLYAVLRVN